MMRHIKYLIFVYILIIIQTQVFQLLSINGITPDILTIWIVYVALTHGQLYATIWGFVAGLMFDLVMGNFIGLSALTKTVAGFTAGYFYEENKAPATLGSYRFLLLVLLVSIIHNTIYSIAFTRGSDLSVWEAFFNVGMATTFYTSALTLIPMFAFARKYTR
ncbi:MAG: rod shape-determining protein MreD [Bacteroidota bacterium]|nr:rod shape-determining protein MreD [Bacteroidota bacterium]